MHTCEYKIGKSHALERLVFVSQHYLKQRTTTNTNKNILKKKTIHHRVDIAKVMEKNKKVAYKFD